MSLLSDFRPWKIVRNKLSSYIVCLLSSHGSLVTVDSAPISKCVDLTYTSSSLHLQFGGSCRPKEFSVANSGENFLFGWRRNYCFILTIQLICFRGAKRSFWKWPTNIASCTDACERVCHSRLCYLTIFRSFALIDLQRFQWKQAHKCY